MQVSQPPPHSAPFKLVYPSSSLQQTTIENAKRIHQLEHLIRAERQELDRLLVQNNNTNNNINNNKRARHSSSSSSSPPTTPPPTSSSIETPPVPTTPPAPSQPTPHASPKGIMYPYHTYPSPNPSDRKPPVREMAARGSHWSFVEKARFEAALHKYGPFAWDQIIRTVGTRSEKQVKAYAARYRRRKKLAAKAQLEATQRLPIHTSTPLPPSLGTPTTQQHPLSVTPTPPTSPELPHSGSSETPAEQYQQPNQFDTVLPSVEDNLNPTTFCDDVFAGNSLFDTPLVDSSVELPDVNEQEDPAQVELLVDRALQGEFVLDNRIDQEREPDPFEDSFSNDFLNTVFAH